ncbi:BPSL0761 family protein [Paraburkholderia sp. 22B1P]|uniref:BPSL0761 family protein n=1 Tax=Paraburkholderia sp. 22B1P TaxID=3080498 RepID=UPI0030D57D03
MLSRKFAVRGFLRRWQNTLEVGQRMTTPEERTRAVLVARELLETLAHGRGDYCADLVRTLAFSLLRHYPLDVDIDVSALALPRLWSSCARLAASRRYTSHRSS